MQKAKTRRHKVKVAKLSLLLYSPWSSSQQLGWGCSGKQLWCQKGLHIMKLRGRCGEKLTTFCSCVFECHVEVWVTVNDCSACPSSTVIEFNPPTHQLSFDLNNDQCIIWVERVGGGGNSIPREQHK